MKSGKTQLSSGETYADALNRAVAEFSKKDLKNIPKALNTAELEIHFLGEKYTIDHPEGKVSFRDADREPSFAVKILILHYLTYSDASKPANRWIDFRQFKGGIAYERAFRERAEGRILNCYGDSPGDLVKKGKKLGGIPGKYGDASIVLKPLPLLPVYLILWKGDEELSGKVKILFDEKASHHLPVEDLATLGELIAEELCRLKSI